MWENICSFSKIPEHDIAKNTWFMPGAKITLEQNTAALPVQTGSEFS